MDHSDEEWKDIPDYEGIYQASTHGRIKRIAPGDWTYPGRIMKQSVDSRGYCIIRLCHQGRHEIKCHRAHKLIAAAFHGPRPPGYHINHLDGVKTNNRPDNLEYVTPRDNNMHARVTGLMKRRLTAQDVREIRDLEGYFGCIRTGRLYGVPQSTIWAIRRRLFYADVP